MLKLSNVKHTWVILGMTLCHLDLVSYMGSFLGCKIKIKMWLLVHSMTSQYHHPFSKNVCGFKLQWLQTHTWTTRAFKLSMSSRNGIFNFMVSIFVGKDVFEMKMMKAQWQKIGKFQWIVHNSIYPKIYKSLKGNQLINFHSNW